jgi:ABC-2 type transport system ATP-binding protein
MYDKLSGLEFLKFTADLYNVPADGLTEEMDRLIDLFGMVDWINDLSEGYSHGMKQRVVLAATLLHKPEVIVVDEPLVGLDPQTSRLVRDIFDEETKNGKTIFMSTHVISIAEEVAHRIGILYHGKLIALGSLEELQAEAGGVERLEDVFFTLVNERVGAA